MSDSSRIEIRTFERKNVFVEREIGKGRFGKVYLATIVDTNLPSVAVKVLSCEDPTTEELLKIERNRAYEELLKLAVLDHENIVKLHGMIQGDNFPWLVFEFMQDGNLLDFVLQNLGSVKEGTLVRYCRDICQGMMFLHNTNILHKDLAARNILISGKTAKIADLGLSSFLTHDHNGVYALNGKLFPFRHAARECVVEQIFTFESDVWSFGILMYEIFSGGMTPYGNDNKQPEVRRFIVDRITPLHLTNPYCSSKIYSLMKTILNPVPEDRPNFKQLLENFQFLLNGKTFPQDNTKQNAWSPALAAFHNIKSSKSSTNIRMSTSPTTTMFYPSRQNDPGVSVLSAPIHESVHSSSSPNLADTEIFRDVRGHVNDLQFVRQSPKQDPVSVDENERRHSYGNVIDFPLENNNKSSSNNELENGVSRDDLHQRSRANSFVASNPLLEGFVQNRFAKRVQSSGHAF